MRLDTQMIIAGNLRTLRLTKRLSQGDMADYIGSSRGLYAHYELGNRTPDAEALYTIANRLGIDMASLRTTAIWTRRHGSWSASIKNSHLSQGECSWSVQHGFSKRSRRKQQAAHLRK